ncbi:MAG: hypothetical protein KatS3mg057_1469 [Herpetosiphonaceae bacterium]|nr:MAG: hypothetical protein KatS3mg057_1469 [Herpetosiphonaceae bacterium]
MDLGLESLIQSGRTPEQAAAIARQTASHPDVQEMLRDLAASEEGREVLEEGRQIWTRYGLAQQWEELLRMAGVSLPGTEGESSTALGE